MPRVGLGTGAAVGGLAGSVIGLLAAASGGHLFLAGLSALAGVVYGMFVAAVPTVLGGIAVVVVLVRRHPEPATYESVRQDLTVVFAAVLGALNAVVLVGWAALGGATTLPAVVAVLAVVDAVTVLVLSRARSSLTRAWAGAS